MSVNIIVLSIIVLIHSSVELRGIACAVRSRHKRSTPYSPYNTGIALAAALAIAVDNGRGDIFESICIQANFNQPTFPPLTPAPFQTIYGDTVEREFNDANDFDDNAEIEAQKDEEDFVRNQPVTSFKRLLDMITRRKFFKLLEHKLKQFGFDGESCLLKAICEASQNIYSESNGILGDIIHILFTPTTSKDEQLPRAYYRAELHGTTGKCDAIYSKKCPMGIFDLVSLL